MNISRFSYVFCALLCLALPHLASAQSSEPFIGRWALTIPGGGAGWSGAEWSGCPDSNWGPPAPKAGALTGLRYTPTVGR